MKLRKDVPDRRFAKVRLGVVGRPTRAALDMRWPRCVAMVAAVEEAQAGVVVGKLSNHNDMDNVTMLCNLNVAGFITVVPPPSGRRVDLLLSVKSIGDLLSPYVDPAKVASTTDEDAVVEAEESVNKLTRRLLLSRGELRRLVANDANLHGSKSTMSLPSK